MTPRPSATRIGLFAIGGLALLVGAVVVVLGGRVFADSERAVMYFDGSVRGLQVGSPVVLRGVQIGSVRSIGLVADGGEFRVPVVAQIDRTAIRTAGGGTAAGDPSLAIPALVRRGLTAQLAMQSLLTGQRYVDLEIADDAARPEAPVSDGLPVIPTAPPALQALQSQLERIDLAAVVDDVRGTLGDARALMRGPEIRGTLSELAKASASLARLSASVERRIPALAGSAERTIARAGDAAAAVGSAAGGIGVAADRIGAAATRADALLAPESPTLQRVRTAADELAKTAAALRTTTAADSATVQQLQQSIDDVGRAARAVRQLADLLERQPEALIRGREPSR